MLEYQRLTKRSVIGKEGKYMEIMSKEELTKKLDERGWYFHGDINLAAPVDVRVAEKYALTIEEASAYFGIGEKKLRKVVQDSVGADWLIYNGVKALIKRKKFERVLDAISAI